MNARTSESSQNIPPFWTPLLSWERLPRVSAAAPPHTHGGRVRGRSRRCEGKWWRFMTFVAFVAFEWFIIQLCRVCSRGVIHSFVCTPQCDVVAVVTFVVLLCLLCYGVHCVCDVCGIRMFPHLFLLCLFSWRYALICARCCENEDRTEKL